MPTEYREQAITDAQIATKGISLRSIERIQHGTRVGAYKGTISFKRGAFVGTPIVMLTPVGRGQQLAGSGTVIPPRVTFRASGSFGFFGTPRLGTLQYLAVGSFAAQ
mgnify:CR=1 FL=1